MQSIDGIINGFLTSEADLSVSLLPAFGENNIPIVLSSSDFFLPYCAVTIFSILNQASAKYNYDILVLTKEISSIKWDILIRSVEQYKNISIRKVDVTNSINSKELYVHSHVTVETYFRLLIPHLFPYYNKMIYLDSDMIAKQDIADIMNINLDGKLLAASRDPVMAGLINGFSPEFKEYMKDVIKIAEPFDYFNAGIMVLNTEEIRMTFNKGDLFDEVTKQYIIVDQDVLNKLCYGKVFFLELEWNLVNNSNITLMNGDTILKEKYIESAPIKILDEYKKAYQAPKVIHFSDSTKPWDDPYEDFADEFWEIAKMTPFYETILYRMYEKKAKKQLNKISNQNEIHNIRLVASGKLAKRIIKRLVLIFLPYTTRRRSFVKKLYYKMRGWSLSE